MTYFAEKLIGLVLCTVFGFTVALGAPECPIRACYDHCPSAIPNRADHDHIQHIVHGLH
jgi:hypothetical protein